MTDFKVEDTTWIQLESVIKCAKILGYEFNGRAFSTSFYNEAKGRKKTVFISFNDMQHIHNNKGFGLIGDEIYAVRGKYTSADVIVSFTNKDKIVAHTTLQYSRKAKAFQCTQHMVKFV
jgi:hypothetical protein